MKTNFNKIKGIIIEKTKEYATQYGKMVGSIVVVAALCVICIISLVAKIKDNKAPSGVMMTLSDVSRNREAFNGVTFATVGITYDSMVNVTYETDQLAQLEKTENTIDEILSARRQDKKDQAVLQALTAQHQTYDEIGLYDPDDVSPTKPPATTTPGTSVAASTPPVVTYADENGSYQDMGQFTLTAYCACPICCGIYSNMENPTTASGTRATAGRTIAADTSIFPFGTKLKINGQIYIVEDTGSAIKGNRIDIYFNSHQDALQFGRQVAVVYKVLE